MKGQRMKFESKSKKLLSITKSKAKMYEFELNEEHHIDTPILPQRLLSMTIGMLGDLCHLEMKTELSDEESASLISMRIELRKVASYFDTLDRTKLALNNSYYLCLLAAATYYLSEMPGSSSVLSKKAADARVGITSSRIELLLEKVLDPQKKIDFKITVIGKYQASVKAIIKIFPLFYSLHERAELRTMALLRALRSDIYNFGSDREILIVDVIISVVKCKFRDSSIKQLPIATGIPLQRWFDVLKKDTFIIEFWPAQKLLADAGIFRGKSGVIQLPTSAGKTKSAEIIMRSAFLSERATTAVIIAPFRSLCREISDSLSHAFLGENILINQLNDVPQIDEFDIDLFSQIFDPMETEEPSPTVIVSTPEKFVYLLRHKPELADEISLVIYDEGHQFDSGQRGVTYELLLTSLKQKLKANTQHVLISAVISNAESIGEWLYAGEGASVNGSEYLATERNVAFSSWTTRRGQFHYVEPLNLNTEEFFVPRVLETTEIPMRGRETRQRYFPEKDDKSSIAAYLGVKLSQYGPVAVFCGTKKTVESICKKIALAAERIEDLFVPLDLSSHDEISKIARLSSMHLGDASNMTKAISLGVLPHSANVPNGLRISVEYAMENDLGRCVVCTSTLAQGVNLPIKYLIVSGVFQGQKRMSTRDFHNLIGRAGRSGKHTEGSIIFTDTELYDRRHTTQRWQWENMQSLLDPAQSEHCSSSLLNLVKPFENDPFGIDPIKFIQDSEKYIQLSIKAARGQDISGLLIQMDSRKNYFKNIESYLLANSSGEEDLTEDKILELYSNTLAYSLADDGEKLKLKAVFIAAAITVNSVEPEKRVVFGKALLGVAELHEIDNWIHENIELLSEELAIEQCINIIWPLATAVTQSKVLDKLLDEGAGLHIAKQWLAGVSYIDILNEANEREYKILAGSQERNIIISHILDICDSALSYDIMLVVGAVADLMESRDELISQAEQVRILQRSLKLGLSSSVEHWLYSKGLADRAICKNLNEIIVLMGDEAGIGDKFFDNHRHYIEPFLAEYPTVFSDSIYSR
jgi:POLQ-like helicase